MKPTKTGYYWLKVDGGFIPYITTIGWVYIKDGEVLVRVLHEAIKRDTPSVAWSDDYIMQPMVPWSPREHLEFSGPIGEPVEWMKP